MKFKHLFAALLAAAGFLAGGASAATASAPIEFNYGYPNSDHVTLYVAQDLGLFEKVGLKPKFFTFTSGAPLMAGLKSESLDVVTSGLGLAFALGQNVPLSILYVNMNDATGEGLVVNKDSPVKSWHDIGKAGKVAAASGTCAQVALYLMAEKAGVDFHKLNIVNIPAPLLRNSFLSNSIDAGIAWSPYSALLANEGFKVVNYDTDYTPGGVCPRMTAVRPDFLKKHPDVGVKLLQVEQMAVEAVAKNPQLAIDALVKRLGLTPAVAKATFELVYRQRPSLAEQLDPKSSHSIVSKDAGLVGKLKLAMDVFYKTKTIPAPIPLSVIQQAVDPTSLERFAAEHKADLAAR
ncbi:ABC transporter substrate-binding protein [Ramlibacter ginsenosidimutans]|uniref:ABC transporter substrate-binding protein n=1 Tax=Ramlibacter ginsenosidimutans TaxID=502333 RepID=A0A934TU68_9BURK|nr:ABC transporter substrate-binding protein [Ramlibacter ginsenosidimutans]MBK6006847.1 ABC transporter substrate-binding protein [Ramlibacter ginsenosidimutans]